MNKNFGKNIFRNIFRLVPAAFAVVCSLVVCALTVCLLAGCGRAREDASKPHSEDALNGDFVYVAEFTQLEELRDINRYSAKFVGDSLYYTCLELDGEESPARRVVCEYSLAEQKVVRKLELAGGNGEIRDFRVADDGSVYVLYYDHASMSVSLLAFDGEENQVWSLNLREEWGVTDVNQRIAVDGENHVCVFLPARMLYLDADGVLQWEMPLEGVGSYVENAGFGGDGELYISYYENPGGYVLAQVQLEERKLGAVYRNYSWGNGIDMAAGAGYDFLLSETDGLYGYTCETQSVSKLLSWTDYGLSGESNGAFDYMEDGNIRVLCGTNAGKTELAVLKRRDPAEVPAKQELVIAVFQTWPDLQTAVAAFNRQSESCHAVIREYSFEFGRFSDAAEKLNIDMISRDRCPDIICLDESLNVKALAGNGAFEDLSPWLEQSGTVSVEDYPKNILEGYTFDGVLAGIPFSFRLETLAGRGLDVGEEPGWTADEMIAFAGAHPDAELFFADDSRTVLDACLLFGKDDFIDWSTGRADFEAEAFRRQLAFAAGFPKADSGSAVSYDAKRLRDGEVLLSEARIGEIWDIQIFDGIYEGDAVFIGYPTADSSGGCRLSSVNAYGIAAASEHKAEAWEFLEYFLSGEPEDWQAGGFPSNTQDRLALAAEVSYVRDQFGELYLDAQGRPVREHTGSVQYNGVRLEYHEVTAEELALLESLVGTARVVSTSDEKISAIIREETEPLFDGRISADGAAAMIQNRVQLYLDESGR